MSDVSQPKAWNASELLEYGIHRVEDELGDGVADERFRSLLADIKEAYDNGDLKWCLDHHRPQPGCPGCSNGE